MSIESQSKKIGFQYFLIGNKNNIGQIENVYSQDGKTNFFEYDFKNNLLTLKKRFAIDYQNVLDWNETVVVYQVALFEFIYFYNADIYTYTKKPHEKTELFKDILSH